MDSNHVSDMNSLTLRWTPQLGHFCHVRGKDARVTPESARSISSTKSTRTFHLQDWTVLGARLDDAKLRIRTEEQRVFQGLRDEVGNEYIPSTATVTKLLSRS